MKLRTAEDRSTEEPVEDTPAPVIAPRPLGSRRRRWLWLAGLGMLALLAVLVLRRTTRPAANANAGQARVVPVGVAAVEQRDVPVWLEGLGNVTSLATVTVRARVSGPLVDIRFQEGSRVKKGDPLVQVDPRPFKIAVEQAAATLSRDQANLKYAKRDLDRYNELVQQKLVSQQQVDQQRSLVDQLAATVALDQASLDNAKLNLQFTNVVSPIDGIAGVRQVDLGNLVSATDANGIVVLTQMDPMAVIFTLPQDDLPRVGEAFAKGPLAVEAYDRSGAAKLGTGKLTVIDNQINAGTATVRLKAEFPNPDFRLWPSQFVKARLLLQTKAGALVIPAPAVQRGPNGTFVYVVNADKTVALRPIQVDLIQGPLAVVQSGLKSGEQVVTDGQNQLRAGARVDPRPSTASSQQKPTEASAQ
jgi:membrane fusion protein, multidrug efflux system